MGASTPSLPPRPPEAPSKSPFFLMGREEAKKRKKSKSLKNQTILTGPSKNKDSMGSKPSNNNLLGS
ncbi:hypothetical protein BJAS_P3439 [Bathymodiolus japonicus methanotrophic gill symbiont]|nr:hypothetical protein BJAS_P3439 [Bathymodiolus japonicus methanotrophic gill symbiont]